MKKLYRKLLIKLGYRNWKPIISQYVSFGTRDIIYECEWTKQKKVIRVRRNFGDGFPIPTTMLIDNKTFNAILNGAKFWRTEHSVYLR